VGLFGASLRTLDLMPGAHGPAPFQQATVNLLAYCPGARAACFIAPCCSACGCELVAVPAGAGGGALAAGDGRAARAAHGAIFGTGGAAAYAARPRASGRHAACCSARRPAPWRSVARLGQWRGTGLLGGGATRARRARRSAVPAAVRGRAVHVRPVAAVGADQPARARDHQPQRPAALRRAARHPRCARGRAAACVGAAGCTPRLRRGAVELLATLRSSSRCVRPACTRTATKQPPTRKIAGRARGGGRAQA